MKNKNILLLGDDPDDRFITESILQELNFTLSLQYVTASDELFRVLHAGFMPHLILLDFNAKPDNGLVVLNKIRSNAKYRAIPVVILGDSSSSTYVEECYAHGANSVIRKPDTYSDSLNKIDLFFRYWLTVVEL